MSTESFQNQGPAGKNLWVDTYEELGHFLENEQPILEASAKVIATAKAILSKQRHVTAQEFVTVVQVCSKIHNLMEVNSVYETLKPELAELENRHVFGLMHKNNYALNYIASLPAAFVRTFEDSKYATQESSYYDMATFYKSSKDSELMDHCMMTTPKASGKLDSWLCRDQLPPPVIRLAFLVGNIAVIDKILQKADQAWFLEHGHLVMNSIIELDDEKILKLVLKYEPEFLQKFCTDKMLVKALENRNVHFLRAAFENGLNLNEDKARELLPIALATYNIGIIKTFCDKLNRSILTELSFAQQDDEQQLTTLFGLALCSPLDELYALAAENPELLGKHLQKAVRLAGLAVRFPNNNIARELKKEFENTKTCIEMTKQYAEKNLEFIQSVSAELPNLTRLELLKRIIDNRIEQNPNIDPDYAKEQRGSSTALFQIEHLIPIGRMRYAWSLRHLTNWLYSKEGNFRYDEYPSVDLGTLGPFTKTPAINYSFPFLDQQGIEQRVKTNQYFIRVATWLHNNTEAIEQLRQDGYQERLHQELLASPADSARINEFYENISTAFWLMSTLCEAQRGTPHNVMIYLNLLFEMKGYPPPVPKREHFFLDNTMLMTPIEEVNASFQSYLEPTLDQGMGRAQISQLLQTNGLNLQLCSHEIRNNKELALIAVQQTPKAFAYVSHELQKDPDLLSSVTDIR